MKLAFNLGMALLTLALCVGEIGASAGWWIVDPVHHWVIAMLWFSASTSWLSNAVKS